MSFRAYVGSIILAEATKTVTVPVCHFLLFLVHARKLHVELDVVLLAELVVVIASIACISRNNPRILPVHFIVLLQEWNEGVKVIGIGIDVYVPDESAGYA